jgi:flagellar basal-body rod protein FlgF
MGEAYQNLISENLALGSVPGARQSFPVFTTDPASVSTQPGATGVGNPAAVRMTRVIDFSQGQIQPSDSPYHVAIQGQAFFEVKETNGTTTYTRNGSFSLSSKGKLQTSDGAAVLGKGGAPITVEAKGGTVNIASDGSISVDGISKGKLGLAHFDHPSAALQPGAYGRFSATKSGDAKEGIAPGDQVIQGQLEQSNANPVMQMADMIHAARLYESNQKTIQAADDNQNKLINLLGSRPQA